MKFIAWLALFLLPCFAFISYRWLVLPIGSPLVSVNYASAINTLPISTLKNLRVLSPDAKKELFRNLRFSERFRTKDICNTILKTKRDPHIILWFTNHHGYVPDKGFSWYKQEILEPLTSIATFWLVDLQHGAIFHSTNQTCH